MQARELVDAIASATSIDALHEACGGRPDVLDDRDRAAVGQALHRHLSRLATHPRYRRWLDVYFGYVPAGFRSPLQQPNFLYYPELPPLPWFEPASIESLARLRDAIARVRDEIAGWCAGRAMRPYVGTEAAVDALWNGLAGQPDWSSIHLLGRNAEESASPLDELPETRAFLQAAPLADFPPHAPECFVSRLAPGVVLPEHFGLSNIKLTVHLPVDIPPQGCSITVGGQTRGWPDDDFLVFDDSFLHTAANRSDRPRSVLIFDIAHPMLDDDEARCLAHAIRAMDVVRGMLATAE
ncbi:MAG: aspartyl/asparaginyl beta-hydroxylase domain-containing protein [Luteimonas sp.]|nr:aspartyl/asparaginyl beta-hydroxylase domain-containing protein [Luteimonas sp.]